MFVLNKETVWLKQNETKKDRCVHRYALPQGIANVNLQRLKRKQALHSNKEN